MLASEARSVVENSAAAGDAMSLGHAAAPPGLACFVIAGAHAEGTGRPAVGISQPHEDLAARLSNYWRR